MSGKSTTVEEAASEPPVMGYSCLRLVPYLRGKPLSAEAAKAIFEWIREERAVDLSGRLQRVRDGNERTAIELEQSQGDELVRAVSATLLASVAVILDLPTDILDLKTQEGLPVDRASISWADASCMLHTSPRGGAAIPPKLVP